LFQKAEARKLKNSERGASRLFTLFARFTIVQNSDKKYAARLQE